MLKCVYFSQGYASSIFLNFAEMAGSIIMKKTRKFNTSHIINLISFRLSTLNIFCKAINTIFINMFSEFQAIFCTVFMKSTFYIIIHCGNNEDTQALKGKFFCMAEANNDLMT